MDWVIIYFFYIILVNINRLKSWNVNEEGVETANFAYDWSNERISETWKL